MKTKELFNLEKTIAKELFLKKEYAWQILSSIKEFINEKGKTLSPDKFRKLKEDIWIAKSAKIADSASLTGPLIIDEEAEIRQSAFIRGSVIIGKNAVVGNSTEIKNSIIFDNVQIPHYNYIGDSVLGYKAHFGAGALTSNVKSDKTLVSVVLEGTKQSTNLKKFGAIVGDEVEIGCHTVLCPGTIIGKNSTIYPLSMVRGTVEGNSIYKGKGNIIKKEIR